MEQFGRIEGVLPENIDEIITASLETINLDTLRIWLCQQRIRFRINNKGLYKTLNNSEIKEIISDTIKQYYYDLSSRAEYRFDQNIDHPSDYFHGGIYLSVKYHYFYLDFQMYFEIEETGNFIELSFQTDVQRLALQN